MKTIRILLAAMAFLMAASCEQGRNGDPGDVYLSVVWNHDLPDYIDAGNSYIPPAFEWGRFYKAYPGTFMLYYEGVFWNGTTNAFYSWEISYTLYENAGKPGGSGYDGDDGPDNFFTLFCSPFGPNIDQYTAKSSGVEGNSGIVRIDEDNFEIIQVGTHHTLKAHYRRTS